MVADILDVEAIVEVGAACAVDGVLTVASDRALPVVAAIADRLGLSGIDTAHAARAALAVGLFGLA